MIEHSGHQQALHDPALLSDIADRLETAIRNYTPHAERIVIRGISGAIPGAIVSVMSGIPLIVIRKDDEKFHGWTRTQGTEFDGSYVIIDDLVDSGTTLTDILDKMAREGNTCAAIFLYWHKFAAYPSRNLIRDHTNTIFFKWSGDSNHYIPVYIVYGPDANI